MLTCVFFVCSLLERFSLAKDQPAIFSCSLAGADLAHLWDHQVSGRPLFPGAGFFEMAAGATSLLHGSGASLADVVLAGVAIPAPMVLPAVGSTERGQGRVQVVVAVPAGRLEVQSPQASRAVVHLGGRTSLVAASAANTQQNTVLGSAPTSGVANSSLVAALAAHQHVLGAAAAVAPGFVAVLARPSAEAARVNISPAVLDGCLQLGAVKADGNEASSQLFVPAGVGALLLVSQAASQDEVAAVARPAAQPRPSAWVTYTNYGLVGSTGTALCQIAALEAKPLGGSGRSHAAAGAAAAEGSQQVTQEEELLYQVQWSTHSVASAGSIAPAVASSTIQVSLSSEAAATAAGFIALGQGAVSSALQTVGLLTQGAQQAGTNQLTPLGGHAAKAAGAWAFMRTVAQELTSFSVAAVDVQAAGRSNPALGAQAAAFLAAPTGAKVMDASMESSSYGNSIQGGQAVAAALLPRAARQSLPAFHLMPRPRGALQNLRPEPVATREVARGKVLVAVKAVGINFRCAWGRGHRAIGVASGINLPEWHSFFYMSGAIQLVACCCTVWPLAPTCRDVLNVVGMYPGDPGAPGGDCAGVVVKAGPGVTHLQPGDAVFGLAAGCLGSHVHVSAHTVMAMPATLSFEEAATTPTVFITVDSALHHAAALQPGERVLVHAAAGGVGLAAMQLIRAVGATTIATAGSSDKRALVRQLGAQHVLGSRDTVFASEAGELGGADVVLNSLTSSGMVAGSLAALNHSGRFVEISKRDIWSAARVAQGEIHGLFLKSCSACGGLPPVWGCVAIVLNVLSCPYSSFSWMPCPCPDPPPAERPDIAYSLVAVDFLPDPAVNASLRRLAASLASGALQPLPRVVHSLGSVQAALRQMAQARHVGKIVVRTPTLEQHHPGAGAGAVAVTGGLGMIGSLVGAWLVREGVRDVALLGRSGRPGLDTAALVELLSPGSKSSMHMVHCDAASTEEVASVAAAFSGGQALQVSSRGGGRQVQLWLCREGIELASCLLLPHALLWGWRWWWWGA